MLDKAHNLVAIQNTVQVRFLGPLPSFYQQMNKVKVIILAFVFGYGISYLAATQFTGELTSDPGGMLKNKKNEESSFGLG